MSNESDESDVDRGSLGLCEKIISLAALPPIYRLHAAAHLYEGGSTLNPVSVLTYHLHLEVATSASSTGYSRSQHLYF